MPNLDVPDPPGNLPYADMENYLNREILKANGILISEAELMVALEVQTNILQAAAAHTLGNMSSKAAIPILKKLLLSSEDLVKVEAAYALARLGVSDGKDGLVQCLDYPVDAYLFPAMAAGYLARLGDPQGFQIILTCLEVNIPAIRMLACKQLYFFAPFEGQRDKSGTQIKVFQAFDQALKDPEIDIQWQALVQLRETISPESIIIIKKYMESTTNKQLLDKATTILQEKHMIQKEKGPA